MSEMLTAKEMQELLQVDRSTIYRMAESGRLPALRVGKQWRFPSEQVEGWFGLKLKTVQAEPVRLKDSADPEEIDTLASLIPKECVEILLDTFADMLGVMLVVTDMEGSPVTEISNPCGLFQAISHIPHAVQRCVNSWHDLGSDLGLEPKFKQSHLGMLCAGSMIRVGSSLKGMVVAGCVAPEKWPPDEQDIITMAEDMNISADVIRAHAHEAHQLDSASRKSVLIYLQRIAHVVAHIVNERRTLVGRLEAIADLTTL